MYQFKSLLFLGTLLFLCHAEHFPNFTNPIVPTPSSNPSVLKVGDAYYLTFDTPTATEIIIYKSQYFTDFQYAEQKTIYKAPSAYSKLTGSNMQAVDNQLVIYFSMQNKTSSVPVLYDFMADDPGNPMGNWSLAKRLMENIWNFPSFHGTVMIHNQRNYFVFASNVTDALNMSTNIYIASMTSGTEISEPVIRLKTPTEDWECVGYCSNDAPSFLYYRGTTYLVSTAGSHTNPGSSLSYMTIKSSLNPLNTSNWILGTVPVFSGDADKNVYATSRATFTTSPDGTETWMIYQASDTFSNIEGKLTARADRILWESDLGTPNFGTPTGLSTSQLRPSGEPEMFTNPIFDEYSPDPGVLRLGDYYYFTKFEDNIKAVGMYKSSTLTSFIDTEMDIVIRIPSGYRIMFGHHIQLVDGNLYMYSTLNNGLTEKVFAYQAMNSSNPMGSWASPVDVLAHVWQHDSQFGTVMTHNGQLYFVFTSRSQSMSIYISPMITPTIATGPVVLLRAPKETWECEGGCNVDGPAFVHRNGVNFMFFSASGAYNPNYCMSYMSIEDGKDPMDTINWVSAPGPVFMRNDEESVYTTGMGKFTTSPDGSEIWMVYHGSDRASSVSDNRIARIEKIEWSEQDGTPIFPKAHGRNNPQPIPS